MRTGITNGTDEDVSVVGPTHLSSVDCESFSAAGATKVDGDVEARIVSLKGSTTVGGDLTAGEFSAKGSTNVAGSATADEISAKGSTRVDGDLRADRVEAKGSSKFGDVSAETVAATGALAVADLDADVVEVEGVASADRVRADEFSLEMGGGESTVEAIVGGTVSVERGDSVNVLDADGNSKGRLDVGTVEGEDVTLEYATADEVTGETVRIGPGSRVDVVRAEDVDVDEDATVERTEELH